MKALFISEETLLDNSIINENVSYTQIRPTVVKVQEMRIQPIVGSPLYGELVSQVVSGSTSALNQTLLEDYIQPAMIQWLYYELPMVLAFKYMNKGMVRRTSEESSQMSMEEITRLTDKVKNDAEWYSERITRYLMENRNAYPLWNSPPSADVQSASTDAGTLDLVVGVYFSDRVESIKPMGGVVSGNPTLGWQDNEDEVLSDQLQVAQDFISSLTNDPSEDWTLSSSVSLTRFVESRDDRTAGWQATMTFEIPYSHSVCQIPT
jgi:hypothetical protein